MKTLVLRLFLLASIACARAEIIPFDLSPAGTDKALGLSPSNEPSLVVPSSGSGGEILGGITFDTTTRVLSLAVGYGSAAGFTDLTGPATAMHIHGSVGPGTNGPVLFPLTSLHLPAADPAKGGIIFGGVLYTEAEASNLLAGLHYVNVHTASNPGGEIRGQLIPVPNHAPSVTCPDPAALECASTNGTPASVSVKVEDADGDALQVVWQVNGAPVQTNSIPAGTPPTATNVVLEAVFPDGASDITVRVSDGIAAPATCSTRVTVQDTKPPVVDSLNAIPGTLWPPNHRMAHVQVKVNASDACGPVTSKIISVRSNEPVNGAGDGNTAPDWVITGDLAVDLRAERAGPGNGRIYTIEVEVTDAAGHKVTRETTVKVPHDLGKRSEPARHSSVGGPPLSLRAGAPRS